MKISVACIFICLLLFGTAFLDSQSLYADENTCTGCHSDLMKTRKSVHAPINKSCEACHKKVEGKNHPAEKKSIILTQNLPGLCFTCHDEKKFKGKTTHSLGGMCLSCHNPHNSDFNKLLRSEPTELCYNCHDKSKFTKKHVHSVINVVGCTTCHSPHASNYSSLLPKPTFDLCVTCHKAQGSGRHIVALPGGRVHPIKGVKDPTTVNMIKVPNPKKPDLQLEVPDPKSIGKELTCVSCHNPHSSDFEHLFPATNICQWCHKNY